MIHDEKKLVPRNFSIAYMTRIARQSQKTPCVDSYPPLATYHSKAVLSKLLNTARHIFDNLLILGQKNALHEILYKNSEST